MSRHAAKNWNMSADASLGIALTEMNGRETMIGITENRNDYSSNRLQVSMVYGLINHTGCWQNRRRIRKSRAASE